MHRSVWVTLHTEGNPYGIVCITVRRIYYAPDAEVVLEVPFTVRTINVVSAYENDRHKWTANVSNTWLRLHYPATDDEFDPFADELSRAFRIERRDTETGRCVCIDGKKMLEVENKVGYALITVNVPEFDALAVEG